MKTGCVRLSSFLFCMTVLCLLFVSEALAQSTVYFAGNARYSIKTRKAAVNAAASVARIVNSSTTYSTEPLSLHLWLSDKPYSPENAASMQVVLVARKKLAALKPDSSYKKVSLKSSGFKRVTSGRYYVILALLNRAESGVYTYLNFAKKLRVP